MSTRKFDGIPTIPMFDMPELGENRGGDQGHKKSTPSKAWGQCPCCIRGRMGLIRQGDHLVWRDHWVVTWGGATRQCLASGSTLCVAASKALVGVTTPTCPCGSVA